jgi:tripartite-type tricarboxylate transporter receptor subunit TctC
VNSFIGLGTSSGTPRDLVERLNAEVRKVMANSDTRQRFIDLGGEPGASTPEEMKDFITREIAKWRYVIATRHIERQ